ncbi:MAG: CHASE domain-containing protein [Magnetococcales bacterium]|nr:CHASE domain-containing protein [Magnetococcales bacterium]
MVNRLKEGSGRLIKNKNFAWMAMLIGALFSLLTFVQIKNQLDTHASREFEWLAKDRGNVLQKDVQDIIGMVGLFGDLMDAKVPPRAEEFNHFSKHLMNHTNGLVSLEWVVPIAAEQRPAFESEWKQWFPNFTILEEDAHGVPVAAASRSSYFPVVFAEACLRTPPPPGMDYGSKKELRDVLERAMLSKSVAISSALEETTPEGGLRKYFVIVSPRFAQDTGSTAPGGANKVNGFAVGTFFLSDLANYSVSQLEPRGVGFMILDETIPDRVELIDFYHSRLDPEYNVSITQQNWREWLSRQTMVTREHFMVADHRWTIIFAPASHTKSGEGFPHGPLIILFGGLVLTASLTMFLLITRLNLEEKRQLYEGLQQSESKLRILFYPCLSGCLPIIRMGEPTHRCRACHKWVTMHAPQVPGLN